jgi:hypothetical protein
VRWLLTHVASGILSGQRAGTLQWPSAALKARSSPKRWSQLSLASSTSCVPPAAQSAYNSMLSLKELITILSEKHGKSCLISAAVSWRSSFPILSRIAWTVLSRISSLIIKVWARQGHRAAHASVQRGQATHRAAGEGRAPARRNTILYLMRIQKSDMIEM